MNYLRCLSMIMNHVMWSLMLCYVTQVSGPEHGSATHEGSCPRSWWNLSCLLMICYVTLCYVMSCLNTYDGSLVLTEICINLIPYNFPPQVIANEEIWRTDVERGGFFKRDFCKSKFSLPFLCWNKLSSLNSKCYEKPSFTIKSLFLVLSYKCFG